MEMKKETLTVSKPAWASKGVIGSVVVMLVGTIGFARLFIPALRDIEIDSGELAAVVSSALTLIFGTLALIGRVKAKSPIHIINRKTVPGGAWNPDAEVRKAERMPHAKVGKDGKEIKNSRGGFVRPIYLGGVVLILAVLWLISASASQTTWKVGRYDEAAPGCGGMSYDEWMRFVPVVDHRPFLVRLWDSLTFSFSPTVGIDDKGQLRASVAKAELKGGADW